MDSRFIVVMGSHHALQGAENLPREKKVDDPSYGRLVKRLVSDWSVDYIFEEASGIGATTASKLKRPGLEYSDVDPPGPERVKLGMSFQWSELQQALWREELWVSTITKTAFKNGLMICGACHLFSVASRLQACGLSVHYEYHLVPDDPPISLDIAVATLRALR